MLPSRGQDPNHDPELRSECRQHVGIHEGRIGLFDVAPGPVMRSREGEGESDAGSATFESPSGVQSDVQGPKHVVRNREGIDEHVGLLGHLPAQDVDLRADRLTLRRFEIAGFQEPGPIGLQTFEGEERG